MTGPEHYAEAERLLALADRHTKGVTYDQEWTLTLTAAQVHATLALGAATAVGRQVRTVMPGPMSLSPRSVPASRSVPARALRALILYCGALRPCSRRRTGRVIMPVR